ncbi:MAG: hypothetical protein MI976_12810, partial [Pseudomonadales bacterium]|nr:hypothetical protein [Pseudomonadales bacterium]
FNSSDNYFRYEALIDIPESIEAKERITIPYRITALAPLDPSFENTGAGGSCYRYRHCKTETHDYECANGSETSGTSQSCWTRAYGDCGSPGTGTGTGGGGGGGGWSAGGWSGGGGGGGGSGGGGPGGIGFPVYWNPPAQPIDDAPFCPPSCPDGECCKEPGDKDGPGEPMQCPPPPSNDPPPPGTPGAPNMCEPTE